MNESIDKFFKDKLEGHSYSPRSDAWAKVEANLSKKNSLIMGWRVAAALIVAGAAIMVLVFRWNSLKETNHDLVIQKEVSTPMPTTRIEKVVPTQKVKPEMVKTQKKQTKSQEVKNIVEVLETKEETPPQTISQEEAVSISPEILSEETSTSVVAVEKPIVIEFTLEEPVQKINAEQKTVEEKSSGLKKVWVAAKELKNGDRSLNLRDAKNDLFALNFKKEKNTTQLH